MQEDLITTFYDLGNIKVENEVVLEYLNKVLATIKEINSIKLDLDKSGSFKILTDNAQRAKKAIDDTTEATNKLGAATEAAGKKQLDAYQQLKAQYLQSVQAAKDIAAQYGAQSDQAIKAAQAANQYLQRIQEIDKVVKNGGTLLSLKEQEAELNRLIALEEKQAQAKAQAEANDPNNVPYTNNLAQLQAEEEASNRAGAVVNELDKAQADAANSATAMGQAQVQTSKTLSETTITAENVKLRYDKYTGTLRDNIETLLLNSQALESNRAAQKKVDTSTEEGIANLARLKQEELNTVAANKELTVTINNQVKEWIAAKGSLDQMQAQLALLKLEYEKLSASQKASPFGQTMLKEVQAMDAAVKQAEQQIGNAQRNVGNYTEAIQSAGTKIANFIQRDLLRSVAGFVVFQVAFDLLSAALENLGKKLFNIKSDEEKFTDQMYEMQGADAALADSLEELGKTAGEVADNFLKKLKDETKDLRSELGMLPSDAKEAAFALKTFQEQYNDLSKNLGRTIGFQAGGGNALLNIFGLTDDLDEATKKLEANAKKQKDLQDQFILSQVVGSQKQLEVKKKEVQDQINLDEQLAVAKVKAEQGSDEQVYQTQRSYQLKRIELLETLAPLYATDAAKEKQIQQELMAAKMKLQTDYYNFLASQNKKGGSGNNGFSEEAYKQQQALQKAQYEILQQQLKDKAAYDKSIVEDDKQFFNDRMDAAKAYYDNSLQLLQNQKGYELQSIDEQAQQEKKVLEQKLSSDKLSKQQREDLQEALFLIDKVASAKKLQVETKYNADVFALNENSEKQITKLVDDNNKKRDEIRKKAVQDWLNSTNEDFTNRQNQLKEQRNKELSALDEQYVQGKIKTEEYEQGKFNIEQQYSLKTIQLGIEQQKKILENLNLDDKQRADATKKLNELEKQADDEITKIKLDNIKKLEDARKELAAKEKEAVTEAINLTKSIVDGAYDKQKNAIQDQINLLQQKKQQDIEAANQSIANAQDRAAAINVINATESAQEQALANKQKKIDEEKAKFDKVIQVAQISAAALQTEFQLSAKAAEAQAQAALLAATPGLEGFAPAAQAAAAAITAEIPLVAGIAAAQIAAVLATPIPKYFKGKNVDSYDAYEGIAWVGDGGRSEAIIRGDGSVEITPDVPTLTYLKSDDIVLPDAGMLAMNATKQSLELLMAGRMIQATDQTYQAINRMSKNVVKAIKEIPQPVTVVENVLRRGIRSKGSLKDYLS